MVQDAAAVHVAKRKGSAGNDQYADGATENGWYLGLYRAFWRRGS